MVWGVDAKNEIYRRTGSSWQKISGGLKVVSCGQPGVWGVNKHDMIYYRSGTFGGGARYINYKYECLVIISFASAGSGWQQVSGRLAWISSGSNGEVWGVNKDGNIYKREGITQANPVGSRWKQVSGTLMKISVWEGRAWGITKDHKIFTTVI